MKFQTAAFFFGVVVNLVAAGLIGHHGFHNGFPLSSFPGFTYTPIVTQDSYDTHPQYNYGYSVDDKSTGDTKSHTESRDGDIVTGRYSLVDADGSLRVVTYTADPINGFNAVVDRHPGPVAAVQQAAPIQAAAAASVNVNHIPLYSAYTPYYAHSIFNNYHK